MASTEPHNIYPTSGRVYTFSEAIEFMKMRDKYGSITQPPIRWVDAKTGKPVSIGYTL